MPIQDGIDPYKEQIENLMRRVADLETAYRAGSTSVDKGKFVVKQGSTSVFEIGTDLVDSNTGNKFAGTRIRRPTGGPALTVAPYAIDPTAQQVSMYDAAGHQVLCDDGLSGQGLRSPLVPYVPASLYIPGWPQTTSATFEVVEQAVGWQQHSYLDWVVQFAVAAGTVGELDIQLTDSKTGGTPFQVQQAYSFSANGFLEGRIQMPHIENWQGGVQVNLRLRRVSGAGIPTVKFWRLYGQGTP